MSKSKKELNIAQRDVLLQRLETFSGEYECHITVALNEKGSHLDLFKKTCESLGGKAIVIVLSNGASPTQPMLGKIMRGNPSQVLSEITHITEVLSEDFSITRVKVEASIKNQGVPESDEEAQQLPSSCYFEHHLKMTLEKNKNLPHLKEKLAPYHGYLSKNAIAIVDDRHEYRFVTQRFRTSNLSAKKQLDTLINYLKQQGIPVSKVIREFNIFDSYADLDAGWM